MDIPKPKRAAHNPLAASLLGAVLVKQGRKYQEAYPHGEAHQLGMMRTHAMAEGLRDSLIVPGSNLSY